MRSKARTEDLDHIQKDVSKDMVLSTIEGLEPEEGKEVKKKGSRFYSNINDGLLSVGLGGGGSYLDM